MFLLRYSVKNDHFILIMTDILSTNWNELKKQVRSETGIHNDVFYLEKDKKNFVVKKISSGELFTLKYLESLNFVLQPLESKEEGNLSWVVFPRLEKPLWGSQNLDIYGEVVKKLAQFHHFTQNNQMKLDLKCTDYNKKFVRIKEIIEKSHYPLNPKIFENIESLIDMIEGDFQLIHGDFLPFNVLLDNDNHSFFIDFADSCLDFGERDIGRFLSDINTFEGTVDVKNQKYYPANFYGELKDMYLNERNFLDLNYDKRKGSKMILLAELWNHLDVIDSCISNNYSDEKWIKLNFDAVTRLVNE